MRGIKSIFILLIAVILACALILQACAPTASPVQPQAKPTVVNIISLVDFTGPYASVIGPYRLGAKDCQEYINENGGIAGVPMNVECADTEGKPQNVMPQYSRLIAMNPKPLLIGGMDTQVGQTLHDRLIEDDIIGLGVSPDSIYPYGNTIGLYAAYSSYFGQFIDYALAKWKAAGKTGKPKLATFAWDIPFGHSFLNAASRSYIQDKVELVGEYYYPTNTMDVTPYVAEAKSKGADLTYNSVSLTAAVVQAKAMKEQGFKPFLAGDFEIDWVICALAGDAVEGWVGPHFTPTWSDMDTNPGVKLINDYFVKFKHDPKKDRGGYYFTGWQSSLACKRVLEDTVARVGWEKLSAKEVKKTAMTYTKSFPLKVADSTIGYWGGFSETEYLSNMGRMYEVKKDPKALLGPLGVFPAGDWTQLTQLVTDKMKQTGRD